MAVAATAASAAATAAVATAAEQQQQQPHHPRQQVLWHPIKTLNLTHNFIRNYMYLYVKDIYSYFFSFFLPLMCCNIMELE